MQQAQVPGSEVCTNFWEHLVYVDYGNKQVPANDLMTNAHADFIYIYPYFY